MIVPNDCYSVGGLHNLGFQNPWTLSKCSLRGCFSFFVVVSFLLHTQKKKLNVNLMKIQKKTDENSPVPDVRLRFYFTQNPFFTLTVIRLSHIFDIQPKL